MEEMKEKKTEIQNPENKKTSKISEKKKEEEKHQ